MMMRMRIKRMNVFLLNQKSENSKKNLFLYYQSSV